MGGAGGGVFQAAADWVILVAFGCDRKPDGSLYEVVAIIVFLRWEEGTINTLLLPNVQQQQLQR